MLCLLLGQTQTSSNLLGPAWIAFGGLILVQISLHIADWIRSSREKNKERDARSYALKKELFLNLLASYYEGFVNLGKIPNAKHSELELLSPSQRSLEAHAAKDLIASKDLLLHTQKAGQVFGKAFLTMMAVKREESKLSAEIEGLANRIGPMLELQQKLADEIVRLPSGTDDARTALQYYFDTLQDTLLPLLAQKTERVAAQGRMKEALTRLHASLMPEFNAAIGTVVIAMRKELGIAADSDVVSAILMRSDREMAADFQDFLDSIWSTFGAKTQPQPEQAGELR